MPTLTDGRYILSTGAIYAIIWTFTAVAALTTSLRLYTRAFIVKALGLDDALILLGQVRKHMSFQSIKKVDISSAQACLSCYFRSSALARVLGMEKL